MTARERLTKAVEARDRALHELEEQARIFTKHGHGGLATAAITYTNAEHARGRAFKAWKEGA